MVSEFYRDKYILGLRSSLELTRQSADFGRELVQKGLKRIFFVACGAPNNEMASVKYWMDIYSKTIRVRICIILQNLFVNHLQC